MFKGKRFIILSAGIILVASLMPTSMDNNVPGGHLDKVVHFLMYFFLGVSVLITFKDKVKSAQLLLFAALIGLLLEVIQQYIPGRNMSVIDGFFNTCGLVASMVLSWSKRLSSTKIVNKLKKWN